MEYLFVEIEAEEILYSSVPSSSTEEPWTEKGFLQIGRPYKVLSKGSTIGQVHSQSISLSHPYASYRRESGITILVEISIEDQSSSLENQTCLILKAFVRLIGRGVSRVVMDLPKEYAQLRGYKRYGLIELGSVEERCPMAINLRYTSRALILNQRQELLLMQINRHPSWERKLGHSDHFWMTIGGGIEPEETELEAIEREVIEETGIESFTVDRLAFFGEHTLLFSGFPFRHLEKYYIVQAKATDTHQENLTKEEKELFRELRWWTLGELLETCETVYPFCLGSQLERAIQEKLDPWEIDPNEK